MVFLNMIICGHGFLMVYLTMKRTAKLKKDVVISKHRKY